MYYLCMAKRREPADRGFSPLFWPNLAVVFPQRYEKFSLRAKNFSLRAVFFLSAVGARGDLSRIFYGLLIINYIKVFGAKKVGF